MIRLKIKDIADARSISQRQIILHSGVDAKNVRRIMRDPYATVNTETLDKFAKFFGVDASELIESVPDI